MNKIIDKLEESINALKTRDKLKTSSNKNTLIEEPTKLNLGELGLSKIIK